MAKPKLALIPASQGTKVYSVLPSDGSGDFDFTRSSKATRINSQGLIEEVLSGQSRLEYPLIDGVVNGCPSLLLEPQSTNLITYSEDFTQSSWAKTNVDVSNNTELSPSGTLTATRIIISATGTDLRTQCTVIASSNYTFSFYAKKGTSTDVTYRVYDVSNGSNIVSPTNYYSQLSTDWERVNLNFTTPSGCTSVFVYLTSDSVEIGDIYLWGAQLEVGSFPTSYIPTNGTTITRLADTATGAGTASTFNDSEGVLMAEISALADDGGNRQISISDSTQTQTVVILYTSTSNQIRVLVRNNSISQFDRNLIVSDLESFNKVAVKYKLNDFAFWVDGFEISTGVSGVTPIGLSELAFDNGVAGADFYGNTKQIQYFQTALTDSELEQLTSWTSFTEMANGQLYTIE